MGLPLLSPEARMSSTILPSRTGCGAGRTCHVGVVGDEHDGDALPVELAQHLHDFSRRLAVERPRRLVRQQNRIVDERAGDGDALLLATGELLGTVVEPVAEPNCSSRALRHRFGFGGSWLGVHQRQHHLAQRRGAGQQIELLETKPIVRFLEIGQRVARQLADVVAVMQQSSPSSADPARRSDSSWSTCRSPEGPMIATYSPARISKRQRSSARTVCSPRP